MLSGELFGVLVLIEACARVEHNIVREPYILSNLSLRRPFPSNFHETRNQVFREVALELDENGVDISGISVNGDVLNEELALVDGIFFFAESQLIVRLFRNDVLNEPVKALPDGREDSIKVASEFVVFSDIFSDEVDAEERNFVLKENLSGLISEALSSVIVVISENDALEVFNFLEDFRPKFAEIAAMRSEDAVTALVESEPVKDAFSDDEGIVLLAVKSVEAERSVA